MGGAEAIMFIGGADHGKLLSLDAIGNESAALMITKQVRFVATDVLPFNPVHKPAEVGSLLQNNDGTLIARSMVTQPGGLAVPAFVYLTSETTKSPKGTCVGSLSMVNMRGISRSFALEQIPEPVKVLAQG
ncbi:hypothetical protein ABID58_006353 [Bradyrhizobium sp. S3.2.6]|uniref:hypothetical protein n=1 Tax=Bradyrhizobium sp. S3.2.6 TaxID=3156428 RepID=UPI003399C7EA